MTIAASVVLTTYNSPDTLILVLAALSSQSCLPSEVLVADDGSGDATGEALRNAAPGLPFPVVRVWQPDTGFRAARSRNNAIRESMGEFLAFLDQDTLPHRDWLATHRDRVRQGQVGIGYVLDLPEDKVAALDRASVLAHSYEGWHREEQEQELAGRHRKYALYAGARRIGVGMRGKPRLRSCNVSLYREDAAAVNGFDEAYVGWGQEDDDFGRRLYAAGIRPVVLVRHARVTHIPHGARHPDRWQDGANVERFRRRDLPVRAVQGLDRRPCDDVRVTRYA